MAADTAMRTDDANPLACLSTQERAVLMALHAHRGRVLSRHELAQLAGLAELSVRRCDSVIVGIRRALGRDSIITVRRRGWMLAEHVVDDAQCALDVA